LIGIQQEFLELLIDAEKAYRSKRTKRHVPEDEIVKSINLKAHFASVNEPVLLMALGRYVRMRAYFNAKKIARKNTAEKKHAKKTSALRKQLK